jgi:hypothetical protein
MPKEASVRDREARCGCGGWGRHRCLFTEDDGARPRSVMLADEPRVLDLLDIFALAEARYRSGGGWI